MTLSEIETVVQETIDRLPDWVHQSRDNIDVLVVEEPDEDHDPEGEGLLGLYLGLPLPERGADYADELPDFIYNFRRPHLNLGLPQHDLRQEIARTLIHEITHYFGIDDDNLDEIGWGQLAAVRLSMVRRCLAAPPEKSTPPGGAIFVLIAPCD